MEPIFVEAVLLPGTHDTDIEDGRAIGMATIGIRVESTECIEHGVRAAHEFIALRDELDAFISDPGVALDPGVELTLIEQKVIDIPIVLAFDREDFEDLPTLRTQFENKFRHVVIEIRLAHYGVQLHADAALLADAGGAQIDAAMANKMDAV